MKRATVARRRDWRRLDSEYTPGLGAGDVLVRVSNGDVVVTLQGPEDQVEPLADRLLRELPE